VIVSKSVSRTRRGLIAALQGSAIGLVTAFVLVGCSDSGGGVEAPLSAAALKAARADEPETGGAPATLRLVTTDQYINTLSYAFGPSLDLNVAFPPLQRSDGLLANSASTAGVTASQLEQFQRAAASVAAQVVDPKRRPFLFPCTPASEDAADDQCATQFLTEVGRLLYRRPLSDTQMQAVTANARDAAGQLEDFYAGVSVALEGMLISPEVLFIAETTEPDPEGPAQERLDAYSLASRLSYFLWNAAPDDELLNAAASGELQTFEGRAAQVDRMLASPRLEDGVRAFFDDMFAFEEFDSLAKDPEIYPFFTGVTLADAREQTLRTVVDHLITKNRDYRDLYTTRETFISPTLASLYQLPAKPGWTAYEFPEDSPRQGLLTHVSFLAGHSHPGRSSPTARGEALREVLLCQPVPPPPPDVDFSLVENPDASYPTQRDRVNAHLANPSCAGCHKITDPMGLALENFDGAGRFRETENGNVIDTSGSLDGVEFTTPSGLAQALRDNPALPACLVERMYSYALGEPAASDDRSLLSYLNERFDALGYRLPNMLRTIALSDAFSRVEVSAQQAQR